jgi:hypothetical protein
MSLKGKPCLECNAALEERTYAGLGTMYHCNFCNVDYTVSMYKTLLNHLNEIYRTLMGADFIPLEISQDIDTPEAEEIAASMIHLGKDDNVDNVPEELKNLIFEVDELQKTKEEVVAMFEKPIEEV